MRDKLITKEQNNQSSLLLWLSVSVVIIAIYNLITFNRFFPITEGWFSVYGNLILQGKTPYKDFYFFLTPLYPLTIAGFTAIFGTSLIFLRILGVLLMLLMFSTIYLIFARFFKHVVAALAAVICMIYYQSGVAHISYDFTQFVTTYGLLSAYFFIRYYDRMANTTSSDTLWQKYGAIFLSGLFAALVFLTKQSNGSLIAAFLFLGILLSTSVINKKCMLKSTLGFLVGAILPTSIVAIWLLWKGAWEDFYQQAVIGAIHAKGSLDLIFFSWIKNLLIPQYFHQLYYIATILLVLGYWRLFIGKVNYPVINHLKKEWIFLLAFGMIAACLIIPFYNFQTIMKTSEHYALKFNNHIIVIAIAISFLYFWYELFRLFLLKQKTPAIIIPALALGFIFGCGTSAGLTETGVFLGFGLFLCYVFSLKGFFHVGKFFCFALCLSLMLFFINKKYSQPYAWWYMSTPPIKESVSTSDIPLIKGFYLPPQTIAQLKSIGTIIQENTNTQDPILAFPNIPIFYLLGNRWADLKAIVHWPDFLPDNLAQTEAKKILAHPPKVIIYLDLPELVWSTHESLFRHNQVSGQRAIIAAIVKLTSRKEGYALKTVIPINNDVRIKVWVRKQ